MFNNYLHFTHKVARLSLVRRAVRKAVANTVEKIYMHDITQIFVLAKL
jgi:hypothetical protein